MKISKYFLGLAMAATSAAATIPPVSGVIPEPVPNIIPPQSNSVSIPKSVLALGDFSLTRTVGKILSSDFGTSGNTAAKRTAFMQTLLNSLAATSLTNPVSGYAEPMTPRTGAAALPAQSLFNANDALNGMMPIFITNRFHKAPANGVHCGEVSLGYGLRSGENNPTRRMTMAFEMTMPNPHPEQGIAGCAPFVNFWHLMQQNTDNPTLLAQSMENLLYNGSPEFAPILKGANIGRPFGQVVLNEFVTAPDWEMRMFTIKKGTSADTFQPQPLLDNPIPALYNVKKTGENKTLTELRPKFQNYFITTMVPRLLALDITATANIFPATENQFNFKLNGGPVSTQYNSFRSKAIPSDDPFFNIQPDLTARIDAAVAAQPISYVVTAAMIASRAGATACAGCHRNASASPQAPSTFNGQIISWPNTLFVHRDELGAISEHATRVELERWKNLMSFNAAAAPTLNASDMEAVQLLGKVSRGEQIQIYADTKMDPETAEFVRRMERFKRGGLVDYDRELQQIRDHERTMPGVFGTRRFH